MTEAQQYRCKCGVIFPYELGKYGCPNCCGDSVATLIPEKIEPHIKQPGIAGPRSNGKGDKWFQDGAARHGSKSNSRKAASALIAKIPFPLAQHIARCFKPA